MWTAWKRCIRMIITSPWGLPCQSIICVSRTFCSHRRGHQHVYKGCEYAHTFSHFETSFLCKFEVASHLRRRKAIMTATSWCLLIELGSGWLGEFEIACVRDCGVITSPSGVMLFKFVPLYKSTFIIYTKGSDVFSTQNIITTTLLLQRKSVLNQLAKKEILW